MSQFPEKAMVFAAGLGTRMRPITDTIPKPLVKVAGKTLLDYTLDKLADAGIDTAIVNTHYKAEQIDGHVMHRLAAGHAPDVIISHEEEVLETGGGIVKALPHLGTEPFFCINSDIIWLDGATPALKRMADFWDSSKMDALLLLHPLEKSIGYDEGGNFFLGEGGILQRPDNGINPPYVYTGVQILSPGVFAGLPVFKFSLRDIYFRNKDNNGTLGRIYGLVHDGAWLHIGTPEGIRLAEDYLSLTA